MSTIYKLIQRTYDTLLAPLLPRKICVYNTVPARTAKLFDKTDRRPEYEEALVAAIRDKVTVGDDVHVIGGGKGVSSVVCWRQSAADGSVTTYEADAERVKTLRETFQINEAPIDVKHAIVGEAGRISGDVGDARLIPASELDSCDVLVLDCEGAEQEIIDNIDFQPRTIIVETHGVFDAPTDETIELLQENGFEITCNRNTSRKKMSTS